MQKSTYTSYKASKKPKIKIPAPPKSRPSLPHQNQDWVWLHWFKLFQNCVYYFRIKIRRQVFGANVAMSS